MSHVLPAKRCDLILHDYIISVSEYDHSFILRRFYYYYYHFLLELYTDITPTLVVAVTPSLKMAPEHFY